MRMAFEQVSGQAASEVGVIAATDWHAHVP